MIAESLVDHTRPFAEYSLQSNMAFGGMTIQQHNGFEPNRFRAQLSKWRVRHVLYSSCPKDHFLILDRQCRRKDKLLGSR